MAKSTLCIAVVLLSMVGQVAARSEVSPVQKVVQLLEECKAKVEKDLAAEGVAMDEYSKFCDDELKDKNYAIETAGRSIDDLSASAEDAQATISAMDDEIATLSSHNAGKEGELHLATTNRNDERKLFQDSEKEMVTSIDQLSRASSLLKKGSPSLMQTRGGAKKINAALNALSSIVDAEWLDFGSRRSLKSFIQAQERSQEDEGDDLSLSQPQAKQVAYESSSGGIIQTVQEMQGKAEDTLSELRKKEMTAEHSFRMIESALQDEIKLNNEKLGTAKSSKSSNEQRLAGDNGKLGATRKSKTADEAYSSTLKQECETAADNWAERQRSAKAETAAIEKAKEILVSGVKALLQTTVTTRVKRWSPNDDEEDDKTVATRDRVVELLKGLSQKHHSFVLSQIASSASSDPFVKIRGLIEQMINKLVQQANEEATHEAFCQEELGKSRKSQEEKTAKSESLQARIDSAASSIGQLTEAVKTLQAEVAEIDRAQAEASEIRNREHSDYAQASKDFRESAQAVAHATEVLKNYYEGALLQVASSKTSRQPNFGSAKSDTGHTIISVLEMAEEDFTTLLAETESTEDEASKAFEKLSSENAVSKAAKQAEAKGKSSEIKSLRVQLEHHNEDHDSVSDELDAVQAYLEKLKPECESKAMSYEERKAARDAEISGLKEALQILEGSMALVQVNSHLRH